MITEFEQKMERLVHAVEKKVVRVGWVDANKTADEAYAKFKERQRTGKPQPVISQPLSLAMIARTMHFGRMAGVSPSGHRYPAIPARPFMDVAAELLTKKMKRILPVYLRRYMTGTIDEKKFMELVALQARDNLQEAINKREEYQALSPATLKNRRHGGDQPLVDTGTLKNSVDFEIKER